MSSDSFPSLRTLLATLTAGVTGTLVYCYLKPMFSLREEEQQKESWSILHVEVPRDTVAYLIGKNGVNIKLIEEKSGTSVFFIDEGGPCKIAVLKGNEDGVQLAKKLMLKYIEEYAQLETSEVLVSENTLNRLTADDNKKMREIASASKTRIYIDGTQDKSKSLLVRGTYYQIEQVREYLKALAVEDVIAETECSPISGLNSLNARSPTERKLELKRTIEHEKLEPTSSDGYCEVMISMVESPTRFFVQKAGSLSKDLDCLIEDITDFYSNNDNRLQYTAIKYDVDDFVAVFVEEDTCWYRARVRSVESNEGNIEDIMFFVSLLDFGDTLSVKKCQIATLRPDFLNLRFQAIECSLANVKPAENARWSEKAIEIFETLTFSTQWKIVMARVESVININESIVYCVKLIDTHTENDIDIAAELVRLGFGTTVMI